MPVTLLIIVYYLLTLTFFVLLFLFFFVMLHLSWISCTYGNRYTDITSWFVHGPVVVLLVRSCTAVGVLRVLLVLLLLSVSSELRTLMYP